MPAKKANKANWEEKIEEIANAIGDNKSCGGCKPRHKSNTGNAIYGIGIMGAVFYYLQHPPVGEIFLTIIKVLLWPAFVAYRLLETFGL